MTFVDRADRKGHLDLSGDLSDERIGEIESVAFKNAIGTRLDFSAAKIGIFTASGSRFTDCDFRHAKLGGGGLGSVGPQTVYTRCRFDRADLRRMWDLGNVRFESCTFDRAKIHDWWGDAAEFVDCHFAGRLTRCRFAGRPWAPMWAEPGRISPPRLANDFNGNDFREAELRDCSFVYGIDLSTNRWPTNVDYIRLDRWPERVDAARRAVTSWNDANARETALSLLRTYSGFGFAEQREIIVRRYDLPGITKELADRIWAVLEAA